MARQIIRTSWTSEVQINRTTLAGLTLPGGSVWRWTDEVLGDQAETAARAAAPVRTGRLRRSIGHSMRKINQHSATLRLSAGGYGGDGKATYARYVHEGTGPQQGLFLLYADDPLVGRRFRDAAAAGYAAYYKIWKYEVAGQKPQPFLVEGMTVALARHGLVM
jgi:hypothetical protein